MNNFIAKTLCNPILEKLATHSFWNPVFTNFVMVFNNINDENYILLCEKSVFYSKVCNGTQHEL